jgi:hypothetical protein
MILECEVGPDWIELAIYDALKIPKGTRDMRCRACHGRLHPHKKYVNGTPAHFEHAIAHDGCSLSSYHYSGVPEPHSDALE